jgi:hypothetical protein
VIPVPAEVRPDPAADFTIGEGTAIRTAPGSAAARRVGEHLAAPARRQLLAAIEDRAAVRLPRRDARRGPALLHPGRDQVVHRRDRQFKINYLHLHLTDDQGWRLQIDSWPRLTEVSGGPAPASTAPARLPDQGRLHRPGRVRGRAVRHDRARDRHARPRQRRPGRLPRADLRRGRAAAAHRHRGRLQLAVRRQGETYAFVEDVIREVAALTPGPYLHIGGDEAHATTAEDYRTFMSSGCCRWSPSTASARRLARDGRGRAAGDRVPQYWRTSRPTTAWPARPRTAPR